MKYIITTLLISLIFTACEKIDVTKDTPRCIKKLIRKGEAEKVDKFNFQGGEVYLLNSNDECCDRAYLVINEDCEEIGWLGGISGNTEINGEEWANAQFVVQVY